jgi:diguanylate cyclase (GGDEF)-like protein
VLPDTDNRFAFEALSDTPSSPPAAAPAPLNAEASVRALELAGQVSYRWDIASDRVEWSSNAKQALGFDPQTFATGRHFATLMDSDNYFSRYDTVLRSTQHDAGEGVPYEIEYRLKADPKLGTSATWIEDQGRWFAGPDGSPVEAIGIMRIADDRHKRDQKMNFLSNCDPLTGMMNRGRMSDALGESIAVSINDKVPCAFAIIAVNNLDVMNEAYGFEVADEVIVALGQRLRHVMRMGDGIARYSGSKFGIILNNCKSDELNAALERFMRAVRDSVIETKMGPVWALLSIGAVSLPALGDNATTAIAHAEEALSEAFRLPGDGYVVFTSSEERKSRRLLNARCATEIVNCLRDGLFKLAFQPVFNAKTREVIMHEALLRMADTTGNLITAGHLVPIAESLGLIRLIDRSVLQLALQTLQTYSDAKLSVNISATTATDPRWNSQLLDMIKEAPEPASRLVIEITETAALGNLATSQDFVLALRSLGCGVALDDFGAGYTSYRNLKELPLTHIKLDGSFCCKLEAGSENHTFVSSMVSLAQAFGLKVVAEWVDTAEDATILTEMGVDGLQGNMLGEASIIAPWKGLQTTAFQLADTSLAPVDASHFRPFVPDIEMPNSGDASTVATSADVEAETAPNLASKTEVVELETLDDAALEAEIAALEKPDADMDLPTALNQPNQDIDYIATMAPSYEMALGEDAVAAVKDEVAEEPSSEMTPAAPVNAESLEIDDSLAQLRAALAELGAALGANQGDEQRLAS